MHMEKAYCGRGKKVWAVDRWDRWELGAASGRPNVRMSSGLCQGLKRSPSTRTCQLTHHLRYATLQQCGTYKCEPAPQGLLSVKAGAEPCGPASGSPLQSSGRITCPPSPVTPLPYLPSWKPPPPHLPPSSPRTQWLGNLEEEGSGAANSGNQGWQGQGEGYMAGYGLRQRLPPKLLCTAHKTSRKTRCVRPPRLPAQNGGCDDGLRLAVRLGHDLAGKGRRT